MDTIFLLIAAFILLVALNHGEAGSRARARRLAD